jgi:hypothetical protein
MSFLNGGSPTEVQETKDLLKDKNISWRKVSCLFWRGKDQRCSRKRFLSNLEKSEVQIYDGLDYRHWDTWNEGKFQCTLQETNEDAVGTDIMGNEKFDSPQSLLVETKITYGLRQ